MDLREFGIDDINSLPDLRGGYPASVAGRRAEIDGDFLSYQCAAETRAELLGDVPMRSLEERFRATHNAAEHIRKMAAAVSSVVHITPSGSDKGGRADIALQQPYQGNREDKERPEHLDAVREYMEHQGAIGHLDQEADDGLAQAGYADPENVVICSSDKDLWMVPGWNLDPNKGSESLNYLDPTSIGWLKRRDPDGKVVGRGPLWFFAQILMGDTADNIKGLPGITNRRKLQWFPTQGQARDLKMLTDEGVTDKRKEAARGRLKKAMIGNSQFGQVKAYEVLKTYNDKPVAVAKEIFTMIREVWTELGEKCLYTNYREPYEVITPTQALLSDMELLWMRRTKEDRALTWIKEIMR